MIMRIPILKSILRNLDWFEEAQKHHKAPEGTIFVGGINHRLKKEDWAEQKHPRADDGKFTSGSGGGSKKPSKTKRKLERRAEAASQGRVSGAIQTLLSGGSALDKIGWLNTSKPKEPEKKPESKPTPKFTSTGTTSDEDLKNDIGRGLLTGVRQGTKSEIKLRELAATGEISWDHEGNMWQSRRGTARTARDLLHQYKDYVPIKTRLQEFEADYKNLQSQAPGKEFPRAKAKLDRLRAEHDRLYGSSQAKVPTNEEMAASGVTERNYREYLKKPPESLSLAEYVAAKQNQYYSERGDILPAETAADWYHADVAEATKKPAPQPEIKVEDGELAGSKILSLGNKRAGVMQHADGSFVVLSQVDRKTVDRKEFKHLDVANRYAEAWLKGGQGVPKQPEKPKVEEKPSQAFNPDDISWSKPASYDGIKQIYPVIRNTGVSSSNLGPGMGIRIDQSGKDAWRVKLLYTGFDKNGHYTSRSVFLGEPGPLRQIKANVKGMMTDNDRLNKLVAELKRRQNELKN
ncbi:MAG: hypothetical protein PHP89_06840 [Candidatus Omnitrophica bacterium]|nr:hypothetical protein [Candidatus Omnitrophota bacterium]